MGALHEYNHTNFTPAMFMRLFSPISLDRNTEAPDASKYEHRNMEESASWVNKLA